MALSIDLFKEEKQVMLRALVYIFLAELKHHPLRQT